MSRRENMGAKRARNEDWSHSRSRSPASRRSPGGRGADTTTDPRTLDARIFIGSLVPELTQDMLKSYFSKYGDVKGVMITKRKFGFVQFSSEHESTKCLADGPTVVIEGHRIDVKPAKIRYGGGGGDEDGGGLRDGSRRGGRDRTIRGGGRGGSEMPHSRRPDYDEGRRDDFYDSYYRPESGSDRRAAGGREPPSGYPSDYPDYYRDYYDRYYREPAAGTLPPPRDYPSAAPTAYPTGITTALDPLDPARPNDCEIVVPDKMQRAYAESIEVELKRCGLLVDILFPPGEVSSSRVLSDLANRRCLYAVFVTPENEKHRSLTLNILHGTPQEHRNMPVDDALILVQRDFEDYVRLARRRNSRETVPSDIRNLMLDLLEAKSLSMGDLDKLIKYLKERQNILVDDQIEQKRESAAQCHRRGSKSDYLLCKSTHHTKRAREALGTKSLRSAECWDPYDTPGGLLLSQPLLNLQHGVGSRAVLEAPRTSQAITYPGYNYAASSTAFPSSSSGAFPSSSSGVYSSSAAPASGYATTVSTRPPATTVSHPVSSVTGAVTAAALAAVTYPGLNATATQQQQPPPPPQPPLGLMNRAPASAATTLQPSAALPSHAVQYPSSYLSPSGLLLHSQPPPTAASAKPELQDRILSLIKTNAVNPVSNTPTLAPPVGVPPPVPAPVAMPPTAMIQRNGSEALYAIQQQQLAKDKATMGLTQPSPYLSAYAGWHQ
ncbi:RNA recognition motif domain [Trinorchestia longiramus]|nr:RNA recognition motif domain [Trinorchestia longiramus]